MTPWSTKPSPSRRCRARPLLQRDRRWVTPLAFAPPRIPSLAAVANADGTITLSWTPPTPSSFAGDAPTGYIIFTSRDGYGFDNGFLIPDPLATHAIIRLEVTPSDRAMGLLLPRWVVTVNGRWLEVQANREDVPEIVQLLVAAEVQVFQVVVQQQSLEALFLASTGGRPMRSALAAEWRKLLGHTKAIAFLVWIYPIGALTDCAADPDFARMLTGTGA
ncbi:MAG: hypothetical protein HC927_11455 [Deltaproteobacteria bacterium]|nr:hypothetical protein [Deltaproteobacteria bacterium]